MKRGKLTSQVSKEVNPYKLDWEGLKNDVEEQPDLYLAETSPEVWCRPFKYLVCFEQNGDKT